MGLGKLTFFVCLLQVVFAEKPKTAVTSLPGNCPKNFEYIVDVDPLRIQGIWYLQYMTNSKIFGCDGSCWTVYAARTDESTTLASLCCQKGGEQYCGEEIGSTVATNISTAARKIKEAPLYYLHLDYEETAVVFYCDEVEGFRAYIDTKKPDVSEDFEGFVFELLRKNNIDPKVFDHVEQSDKCNYRILEQRKVRQKS